MSNTGQNTGLLKRKSTRAISFAVFDTLPQELRHALAYAGHNFGPKSAYDYAYRHGVARTIQRIEELSRRVHYRAFPEQAPSTNL